MVDFNLGQSLGQGMLLGNAAQDTRRKNALEGVYAQHGAGIASGDQNALNALAAIDPQAASTLQRQFGADQRAIESHDFAMMNGRERLGMARESHASGIEVDKARIDQIRTEAEAKTRQAAKDMSDQEAAAASEQINRLLQPLRLAYQNGDEQGFNGIIARNAPKLAEAGVDPASLTFDQALYIIADLTGDLKGLVREKGGHRPATPEEAAQYGAAAGQFDLSNGRFYPITPPKGSRVEVGPDGQVSIIEGPGVGGGSELTNTLKTEVQRAEMAYSSIMGGLDAYEEIIGKGGAAVFPGKQKDALDSARRDLQLQLKELFNLGVLNGPDLDLMDQLIVDATSPTNYALDKVGLASIEDRTAASVKQLREQLTRLVGPKLAASGAAPAMPDAGIPEPVEIDVNGNVPDFFSDQDKDLWPYMEPSERQAVANSYRGQGQ